MEVFKPSEKAGSDLQKDAGPGEIRSILLMTSCGSGDDTAGGHCHPPGSRQSSAGLACLRPLHSPGHTGSMEAQQGRFKFLEIAPRSGDSSEMCSKLFKRAISPENQCLLWAAYPEAKNLSGTDWLQPPTLLVTRIKQRHQEKQSEILWTSRTCTK